MLVCFGGGDVSKENELILDAFEKCKTQNWEITIIGNVKKKYDHFRKLSILEHSSNISKLMFDADFAVLGSGLIRYEAALSGIPSLVFSRNKHSLKKVEEFVAAGLCENGGLIQRKRIADICNSVTNLSENKEKRKSLHNAGFNFDGLGLEKIANGVSNMSWRQ